MYEGWTAYIVGNSKTNSENAIMNLYKSFYIGFVLDMRDSTIVDVSCSSTLRTTEEFVKSIFIGKKMGVDDEMIEDEVKLRYHGSSQKAICVAYKDAVKKLIEIRPKFRV